MIPTFDCEADWRDRHDRRFDHVIEVDTRHPVGRFLAACAEAGYPAVIPAMYARSDVATIEWPDDRLIPAEVFAKARELCGADVWGTTFQGDGDRAQPLDSMAVVVAYFADPWPESAGSDWWRSGVKW